MVISAIQPTSGSPPTSGLADATNPAVRKGTEGRPRAAQDAKEPTKVAEPGISSEIVGVGQAMVIKQDSFGKPVIQVVDKETGEVIREIPPVEVQKVLANLERLRGLFLNQVG